MENIYNRTTAIDEYSITNFEYELMPDNIKLAYAHNRYGYDIEEARKKESGVYSQCGYIHPKYENFFKQNGCTYENYDFGVETYEIKSIDQSKKLEISEDDLDKLEYYRYLIATARTDAFDKHMEQFYESMLNKLNAGESISLTFDFEHLFESTMTCEDLPENLHENERRLIMEAELYFIKEAILKGEAISIDFLPTEYQEVLKDILEDCALAIRDDEHQKKLK